MKMMIYHVYSMMTMMMMTTTMMMNIAYAGDLL